LDGVLVPAPTEDLQQFQAALEAVRDSLVLVYVSGRRAAEQAEDIDRLGLLTPDYLISALGTEIYRMPGQQPLSEWERYIEPDFDRTAIAAHIGQTAPMLELQPEESQAPMKLSYFWRGATREQLEALRRSLLEAQQPVKLVYSHDVYLDIIPERGGNGAAVKFLVDSLLMTPVQVFVSGDSGNDVDLFQYGFRGIVVGNATHELREAVQLRAYFSHRPYAAGVLEGLKYYKFFRTAERPAPDLAREAFEQAVSSLRRNITPMGFSAASLTDNPLTEGDSNYFAVWSRDGIKTGLWAMTLNDADINECFRRTLLLMAEHQTANGQIPANVQIENNSPDYGGIGGIASIDSVLWYVIGACRFAAYTADRDFLVTLGDSLQRAMSWLEAHDSNNCGLLEIPESSDWMDLFPRSYNVLYDEVLWYQACLDMAVAMEVLGDETRAAHYRYLTERVRGKILRQFWPTSAKLPDALPTFAETQFTIGNAQYLLAQISPFSFSWRCDVYANLLAALVGLLDDRKMDQLFHFLWGVGVNSPYPVKCLYPAIQSGASDWKDYIITNLLNLPEHYHNGGIWPFIGGLWVRFLARTGRAELANQELNRLAEACRQGLYEEWEFNEWMHGQTGRPMGKAHQAWSSAAYIAAYQALNQEAVPFDFEPLTVEMFGV
jgi:sucrose-6F-phosphate phosphohydrolase